MIGAFLFLDVASVWSNITSMGLLQEVLLLFLVGALFHIYGFVLNEWADVEVDRASPDLQHKPLVSGEVSSKEALWTAITAAVLTFVVLALVTLDPMTHLVLLMAVLMAGAYDLFGKRAPLDVLLAGSITLLFLAGAMSLGHFDPSIDEHLTIFLCIGGLQFLQNLYQNAIEGGMKDADHDAAAGARTYATILGVRVNREGEMETGWAFTNSAIVIKGVQIFLLLYTAVEVTALDMMEISHILWGILILAIIGMIVTTSLMLPPVRFDRSRLKRIFSIHELATFAAIMVVIVPLIGGWMALFLFLLPMFWFGAVNRLLFGGTLEPGV
jgi:4-hydroxybenzoate polyprenyltransferase